MHSFLIYFLPVGLLLLDYCKFHFCDTIIQLRLRMLGAGLDSLLPLNIHNHGKAKAVHSVVCMNVRCIMDR